MASTDASQLRIGLPDCHTTTTHTYEKPGRYTIAVKVIDIFGNDTMTLVTVNI